MSTIRATNIQPQSDSDPLVFSTNATEKLRIPSTGAISLTGGATLSGGLSVTGNVSTSGNLTLGSATLSTPSGNAPLYGARAWGQISHTSTQYGQNFTATVSSGVYTVTLTTPMQDTNYGVIATAIGTIQTCATIVNITSASQFTIRVFGGTDNLRTDKSVMFAVFA
jgi:hypothetical protein